VRRCEIDRIAMWEGRAMRTMARVPGMKWTPGLGVLLLLGLGAPALLSGAAHAEPAVGNAECASYCEAVDSDCSRFARDQARQCNRDAATGGVDPFTGRRDSATYYCGFFADERNCRAGQWRARCVERFRTREAICADEYARNHASEYMACEAAQRTALAHCRDELAACRDSC
jgi:hypothetical protein